MSGELWIRRDLLDIQKPGMNLQEIEGLTERETAALDELLEDARWAFSGMLYGFTFSWTPPATARNVEERLEITPIGLIPRGDPRLKARAIVEENGFLYIQLEYMPDASQQSRLNGWAGQAYPGAAGIGEVSAIQGGKRRDAMEEAIKQTIRAWLRAREFNRPRKVTGRIALTDFPVIGLRAGNLRAVVNIRMDLDAIEHYQVD